MIPIEDRESLQTRLEETLLRLIAQGIRYFGAGGALGFDTIAALTVIKLRETHPHIRLILVLPCKDQPKGWNQEDVKTYKQILLKADKFVHTSERYYSGCMHKRNRRLVDHSAVCVCYLIERTGGTAYTVRYAELMGLRIINLALTQTAPAAPRSATSGNSPREGSPE